MPSIGRNGKGTKMHKIYLLLSRGFSIKETVKTSNITSNYWAGQDCAAATTVTGSYYRQRQIPNWVLSQEASAISSRDADTIMTDIYMAISVIGNNNKGGKQYGLNWK